MQVKSFCKACKKGELMIFDKNFVKTQINDVILWSEYKMMSSCYLLK